MSAAAGVAAVVSAAPAVGHYRVELAVAFIGIIAWGNLRGVRESGRMFAIPTYIFIGSVFVLLAVAGVRAAVGDFPIAPAPVRGKSPAAWACSSCCTLSRTGARR